LLLADAFDYLANFEYSKAGKTLIYADPPYMHSTRTSKARYEHELTDQQHLELLQILQAVPASVILSGYRNDLYDTQLAGWWSMDFQAMTRGGVRTETVWCNFEPGEIHYHTYAGKNSTDRQRIQRKAARWAKNFAALPQPEKQAVLAALLAASE
jgi:site-specific DNA-adenine methylase